MNATSCGDGFILGLLHCSYGLMEEFQSRWSRRQCWGGIYEPLPDILWLRITRAKAPQPRVAKDFAAGGAGDSHSGVH